MEDVIRVFPVYYKDRNCEGERHLPKISQPSNFDYSHSTEADQGSRGWQNVWKRTENHFAICRGGVEASILHKVRHQLTSILKENTSPEATAELV